jgi:hypothetical protein
MESMKCSVKKLQANKNKLERDEQHRFILPASFYCFEATPLNFVDPKRRSTNFNQKTCFDRRWIPQYSTR